MLFTPQNLTLDQVTSHKGIADAHSDTLIDNCEVFAFVDGKPIFCSFVWDEDNEVTWTLPHLATLDQNEADYRYGSAKHQMLGDAFLFQDCPGAW